MPRYFFNIHDGVDRRDQDGIDFPDVTSARGEAVRATGEILRDEDGKLIGKSWVMEVTDEDGHAVLRIGVTAETPEA